MARGVAANTLVLLASNFRALFTFLIARMLGEAALGRFGLAFATTELLSKVGMLGFDNAIVPFVARSTNGNGSAPGLLRRTLLLAITASTLVMILVGALVWWWPSGPGVQAYSSGAGVMLLALPGIAVARIATGASRAVLAMRSEFYSRGLVETWVTTGVFVAAIALGIRDTAPALAVAIGATAAAGVAYVLAAQALSTRVPAGGDARPSRGSGVAADRPFDLLRFSLPIAGSSLLTVLVMRVDVLLLGAYVNRAPGVTVEAFGIFCAAAEVAGGLRKVRQVFDPIFAPIVASRLVASTREGLRQTVAAPGRWVLAAQVPLVAVLVLAGSTVMSIYGPGFRAGGPWLAILAVAHGTNTFAGLIETLLMIERPGLNVANAVATVIAQVVAGVLLIPPYGVTGAAVAMCLGFAVQGLLRFVEVRHVFGWSWPWESLGRPLAAGAVAAVPSALTYVFASTTWREPLSAVLFVALYVGTWFWFGLEPADAEVVRRLVPGVQIGPRARI
jgi:O-antigen/teichoic acid export membrane protein